LGFQGRRLGDDAIYSRGLEEILPAKTPAFTAKLKKSPGAGPGLLFLQTAPKDGYSCPYFRNTSRQELPMRQLWAASVAPHWSKLLQVMPAERSHSRAAAGLQGASSAISTAPALVLKAPRMRHAANIIFILKNSPLLFGRRAAANAS
jgi:hypothetical protein